PPRRLRDRLLVLLKGSQFLWARLRRLGFRLNSTQHQQHAGKGCHKENSRGKSPLIRPVHTEILSPLDVREGRRLSENPPPSTRRYVAGQRFVEAICEPAHDLGRKLPHTNPTRQRGIAARRASEGSNPRWRVGLVCVISRLAGGRRIVLQPHCSEALADEARGQIANEGQRA